MKKRIFALELEYDDETKKSSVGIGMKEEDFPPQDIEIINNAIKDLVGMIFYCHVFHLQHPHWEEENRKGEA